MKTTLQDVMIFRTNAERYLNAHKDRTKFTYALEKMISRTNKYDKQVRELSADLAIDHASVDDKGNLIVEKESYVFTPTKKKEMDTKLRKALEKEVEVEPYQAVDIPELRADWEDVLLPFVTVPKMEANNEAEKAA